MIMSNNNERNKYFIKNTAIFAIGNMSTKLISFLLVPLYTYVLSTSDYGTIDLVFTLCGILTPVVMCNIGESIKRFSLGHDASNNEILTVAFIWIGIGIVLTTAISPLFKFYDAVSSYVIQMYIYILIYAINIVFTEYLRGKEKFISYTVCSVTTSLIIAVLNIVFLVVLKLGIQGYFLAYIIAYSCSALLAFILWKPYKVFKHWAFNKILFKEMSAFSIMLVPNSLFWWVINSSDRIMVTSILGAAANGLLTVAYKVPSLMTTLSSIVMQAWQYSAIKEKESSDKSEYSNKMFDVYIKFTSLLASFLIVAVKPMLSIYVAPEYYSAWQYSPFLIVGFMFLTLATFVGTSYYVEKDMKGNLTSAFWGAIVNVALNFILIYKVGIIGATVASCISNIVIFAYRMADTKKYLKLIISKSGVINFCLVAMILAATYVPGKVTPFVQGGIFVAQIVFNKKMIISLLKPILNIFSSIQRSK